MPRLRPLSTTINTEGCSYRFATATPNVEGVPQAKFHLDCEAGKEIVVNSGFGSCITRFPAQTPGGVVDFENKGTGSARDTLFNWTVTGIRYTQEGFTCTGGTGTFENGTYAGSVTTKGSSGGSQVGIWVTGPTPAARDAYDSEAEITTLEGTQATTNVFTTNAGTVKCEVAEFEGTERGAETESGVFTAAEIEVHPEYSKCRAFGLSATVDTEGCDYKFTTAERNAEGILQAKPHVVCEAGKEIIVNGGFGSCISRVPAQTPAGVVDLTNEGAGKERDVLATATVTGIRYTQEGFACNGGNGTFENGTYAGSVTTKGYSGESQVGIWVTAP